VNELSAGGTAQALDWQGEGRGFDLHRPERTLHSQRRTA